MKTYKEFSRIIAETRQAKDRRAEDRRETFDRRVKERRIKNLRKIDDRRVNDNDRRVNNNVRRVEDDRRFKDDRRAKSKRIRFTPEIKKFFLQALKKRGYSRRDGEYIIKHFSNNNLKNIDWDRVDKEYNRADAELAELNKLGDLLDQTLQRYNRFK